MTPSTQVAVSSLVKKIVARGRENKMIGRRVWNAKAITPGITAGDSVCPEITKGTEEFQRVGDRVQPKWLGVKGTIAVKYDQNTRSDTIHARLMVVRMRQVDKNTESLVQFAANSGTLLKTNLSVGSSEVAYTGAVLNNAYPINDTSFRVLYDKVFALGPAYYQAGFPQPSNFGSVHRFSVKLPLPASLMFDDTSNQPQNYAPIILLGYCYPDGRPIEAGESVLIADAYSRLIYEDA